MFDFALSIILIIWDLALNHVDPHMTVRVAYCLLGITIVGSWHFIINVVNEMATALEISVFKIEQKVSLIKFIIFYLIQLNR